VEPNGTRKPIGREYPLVQIPDTVARPLVSESVEGMEYQIYISLPDDYDSSTLRYPVVYFLDAWAQFAILKQTYWLLRFYDETPPLLLVGIAFKGDAQSLLYYRSRDYTPTTVSPERLGRLAPITPVSGGAEDFTRFLERELFPMIETEYRGSESDRAIFGVSYGGLFATYVLFNHPGLFQRYLMGTPAWEWDDEIVFRYEEDHAHKHDSLEAKVITTIGSEEGESRIRQWERMCDRLKSRAYRGFELSTLILEGETHMSGVPAAISRALRNLYRG